MASFASLYDVLGIPTSASCVEIKAAYRRAVAWKERSAKEFIRIHEACSTLSDPDKRASYDQQRVQGWSRAGAGYTPKKWETDQCW
ncbi:hypothetical protein MLD38_013894 [Melastoma candidum]|uniref:Uncharacterized protein n=1 Tax=Melastoma candidum TaxID=119954 RepID=A0ACB9RE52_9MYRT|nr:hypothetical protein MLD38_013894 [Melastoma candidum]